MQTTHLGRLYYWITVSLSPPANYLFKSQRRRKKLAFWCDLGINHCNGIVQCIAFNSIGFTSERFIFRLSSPLLLSIFVSSSLLLTLRISILCPTLSREFLTNILLCVSCVRTSWNNDKKKIVQLRFSIYVAQSLFLSKVLFCLLIVFLFLFFLFFFFFFFDKVKLRKWKKIREKRRTLKQKCN